MHERPARQGLRAARMSRVEAIVLNRDVRQVLVQLGHWGQAQLIRTSPGPDSAPLPPRDNRSSMEHCLTLLERAGLLRHQLGMDADPRAEVSEGPIEELEAELGRLEQRVAAIVSSREQLTARLEALASDAEGARPLLEAGLAPDTIASTEYLHFALGSIPIAQGPSLQHAQPEDVVVVPLGVGGGRQRLLAATRRDRGAVMQEALARAGFEAERASAFLRCSLESLEKDYEQRRLALQSELDSLHGQLQELSSRCTEFVRSLEARAQLDRALLEAESSLCRTESTTLVVAWVPESGLPELEHLLREATRGRFLMSRSEANAAGQEVPVLLQHGPWIRPYAMLVEAYGTPLYTEIEPTLFMAVSYVLMFGVMFGDVGHGALLIAAGIAARRFSRGMLREVAPVLVFAGGSSCVFGALYGSCFGIHALQKYALWRDPIAGNPVDIMIACIGFGIGLISLGIVLNVVNHARRRDWAGALLDKFGVAGLLFYWGAVALLVGHDAVAARGLMPHAVGALALPVVAWLGKEPVTWLISRKRKEPLHSSFGAALGESASEAFEGLLVYLASTISFVRLAAYAMSHAALLLAIFMVSAEVRTIPGGATAVAVVGNAVVIILEAVIAAVQALRLEYYEFFGKFFSGDGRPFTPFHLAVHGRAAAHAQRS